MIPAIELLKTADLKPHPLSVKIYGEPTASEELLRSIAEIGVVQPIVVDTNNSIIAGTSRHFAAVQAQQETIPATRFAGSALDGEWLVIESNRQRVKTACQLGWEFNERFRLEGERAKARQLCGRDLPPEMAEGRSDARDRAARAIGLGRTTAERIGFLVAKAEEGNPRPRKLIAEIDIGKLSISGAWDLWKPTQKNVPCDCPKCGETFSAKGHLEKLVLAKRDPWQSGTIELARASVRREFALERQMGPIFVVFGFPSLQFSSKIPFMFEMPFLVELLRIGLMTSLDLSVHLRAAWRYVFVGNAEVRKMPSELWSERVVPR